VDNRDNEDNDLELNEQPTLLASVTNAASALKGFVFGGEGNRSFLVYQTVNIICSHILCSQILCS
jgi:hypothetical protein